MRNNDHFMHMIEYFFTIENINLIILCPSSILKESYDFIFLDLRFSISLNHWSRATIGPIKGRALSLQIFFSLTRFESETLLKGDKC